MKRIFQTRFVIGEDAADDPEVLLHFLALKFSQLYETIPDKLREANAHDFKLRSFEIVKERFNNTVIGHAIVISWTCEADEVEKLE